MIQFFCAMPAWRSIGRPSAGVMELAEIGPNVDSKISAKADIEIRKITAVFEDVRSCSRQMEGNHMTLWCEYKPTITVMDFLDAGACIDGVVDEMAKREFVLAIDTAQVAKQTDRDFWVRLASNYSGYGYGSGSGYGRVRVRVRVRGWVRIWVRVRGFIRRLI